MANSFGDACVAGEHAGRNHETVVIDCNSFASARQEELDGPPLALHQSEIRLEEGAGEGAENALFTADDLALAQFVREGEDRIFSSLLQVECRDIAQHKQLFRGNRLSSPVDAQDRPHDVPPFRLE